MRKKLLRGYARLIALSGANVQPDQEVFIGAGLDQPEFVTLLVEECYKAGAKKVVVEWNCQAVSKLHYQYRSLKTLSKLDSYELARWKHYAKVLPARIYLTGEDPDGFAGMDMEKMSKSQRKLFPIIKPYRDAMENKYQWCIAAVPGAAWAKKLFPDDTKAAAVEKLWKAILAASRADGPDPVKTWEEHNRSMKEHCAKLNALGIKSLHYTAANGTDFTVGLIPQGRFCGGAEDTLGGVTFNPNIPTEECFTSPMKGEAEGIVYATKPLSYQGQLIDGFWIRFREGKAVEWHADKNEDVLAKLIGMDPGSAYLGECALVPYTSPINLSGILFYNTLFDENAVCHLALGRGFPDCIEGFEEMTQDEIHKLGVNDSFVHCDFMIGSEDLAIDATLRNGSVVPVFRNGVWAI
ncbi:MAG: aminopeptidase [Lachnospiraceae bacterium]|nr:aminopeptidase [Lachnospiraceae bacterium]